MHEHQPQPPTAEPAADEEEPRLRPRIYVASLADYTRGVLHGRWLDATLDPAELEADVQAMLADSPTPGAEEAAIHDHDSFAGIHLDEHESFATVSRIGQGLAKHGVAFAGLVELLGREDATEEAFAERYFGVYPTIEAYAEELLEVCGAQEHLAQLPRPLQPYVRLDPEALARDMQANSEIHTRADTEGVHVLNAL